MLCVDRATRTAPSSAAAFFSGPANRQRPPARAVETRRPEPQPAFGCGRRAPAAASVTETELDLHGAATVEDEEGGSIGQFLVESLTAQSLDLPPQVTPPRKL